jgi:hypothetical protein
MTQAIRTTVKYTTRLDGNGIPVAGFYIIANGLPIGRAWQTYEATYASMEQYLRELRGLASV